MWLEPLTICASALSLIRISYSVLKLSLHCIILHTKAIVPLLESDIKFKRVIINLTLKLLFFPIFSLSLLEVS